MEVAVEVAVEAVEVAVEAEMVDRVVVVQY